MRKSKKLLGIALVPCMVGSLLAGCTASSDTDATPVSTEETEAPADDATTASEDAAETTEPEETEEPTEAPDNKDDQAAFMDLLKGVSDMEAYRVNTAITVNQKTTMDGEDDEESEVTLNLEALTDGKGNISVTLGADYVDDDLGIALNGDLLTISKVDDRVYLDLTAAYDIVMDMLGDDSQYIEQYASAFDLSMDELEELLVLGIPVGDLELSGNTYKDMEEALDLIYDDMAVAIDNLGDDFLAQDGNTYTLTVNNDNLLAVSDAFIDAFEGNMGDIYDAYVEAVKKSDYSDQLETVTKAIVNEVIEGIEAATETEIDEDARAEVEEEIQSAIEEYQSEMEEAIQELEDGKDAFLEEFNSAVEEYRDSREDMQAAIDDSEDVIEAVVKVTFEGEEGSRTITSEMTASAVAVNEYDYYDEDETITSTTYVTIAVKSVIEEGDVEISAPKKYAPLSKAVELAYRVYTIYEEMSQDDDDWDDDYDWGDDYDWDDDDYVTKTYTQDELAEIYGVTLKKNQAIAIYSTELDGVLITAYDDMEFYEPDDMDNMQMETSDSASTYITVFVYDSSFDKEFVTEYYEGKELDDNMYYIEKDNELELYVFENDITIDIEFEAYGKGGLEEYTDGDGEAFMKGLAELCEILPAQ